MPLTQLPLAMSPGYNAVPRKLQSSQPAADHQGFFKAVGEALEMHTKELATPPTWNVTYVEEYPKSRESEGFDHSFDVILYKVISSVPAGTDRTGHLVVPNGLRRFDSRPHPTKARYHLITDGWTENSVVEFQLLSKSNQTANEMAVWFHRFMMQYAYAMKFFVARGVEKFLFVERLEDDTIKEFGQELYRRRLRYQFRIAFLITYEAKDLESIHAEVRQHVFSGAESPTQILDWSLDDGAKPQG